MKRKNLQALREKKIEELNKIVDDKRKEVRLTLAKIKAGYEKNTSKAKNLKRDIAQILTIKREKEIFEKLSKRIKK